MKKRITSIIIVVVMTMILMPQSVCAYESIVIWPAYSTPSVDFDQYVYTVTVGDEINFRYYGSGEPAQWSTAPSYTGTLPKGLSLVPAEVTEFPWFWIKGKATDATGSSGVSATLSFTSIINETATRGISFIVNKTSPSISGNNTLTRASGLKSSMTVNATITNGYFGGSTPNMDLYATISDGTHEATSQVSATSSDVEFIFSAYDLNQLNVGGSYNINVYALNNSNNDAIASTSIGTLTVTDSTLTREIHVTQPTGGTVAVNPVSGKVGNIITVTATPDAGYYLKNIMVDGQAITGTTFVMKDADAEVTADFAKIELDKIEVTTKPNKMDYTTGEFFAPVGMVVTATYTDGHTAEISGYTYTPTDVIGANDGKVVVSYVEGGITKTSEFDLNVTVVYADYSKVDTALGKIPTELSNYTDTSVKALNDAKDAVVRGKDNTEQKVVDGYATAIENAIKALAYKPADYSKVDAAIAKIPADLSSYTDASVKALNDAKSAVVRGKNITEQATVDGYATALESAVNGLAKLSNTTSPKTADTGNAAVWAGLVLVAGGVLAALAAAKKRRLTK